MTVIEVQREGKCVAELTDRESVIYRLRAGRDLCCGRTARLEVDGKPHCRPHAAGIALNYLLQVSHE